MFTYLLTKLTAPPDPISAPVRSLSQIVTACWKTVCQFIVLVTYQSEQRSCLGCHGDRSGTDGRVEVVFGMSWCPEWDRRENGGRVWLS